MSRDELIERIDAFLKRTRMAPYRFGVEVMGDPSFVIKLKAGRCPRMDTAEKVEKFIAAYDGADAA